MADTKFECKLLSDATIDRMIELLPDAAQKRILKPVMAKAARVLVDAARSEAPKDSGLLSAALGSTTVKTYGSRLFLTTGVRRGFRRAVDVGGKGKVSYLSARRTQSEGAGKEMRDPTKYMHLVTGGRKALTASGRTLWDGLTDTCFGKHVAAAKPNPFMSRAFSASQSAVLAAAESEAGPRIEAEAAQLCG